MLKEERLQKLLELLEEKDFCTVDYLSEQLNVSMPTVRRDLNILVNRNLIIRSHGGAMHIPREDVASPVDFRRTTHYREKVSLARAAVDMIPSNAVIFIDSSTTAGAIAENLKGRQDLTIITNGLMTAAYLKNLGIPTYCLGGEVLGNSSAVGGFLALETVASFNVDLMFFSAFGINHRGMIVDNSEEEAELRSALLKTVQTSVFLCDNSKFDLTALFTIAPLSQVDYLITNSPVPASYPSVRKQTIVLA